MYAFIIMNRTHVRTCTHIPIGTLVLRFSETVNGASLDVTQLTLQAAQMLSDLNSSLLHSLVLDQDTGTRDGYEPTIVVSIGTADLNEIKRLTQLATSNLTTYLSLTSSAIEDTAGNNVTMVTHASAIAVTTYKGDENRPELVSFDLDLDSDVLTLTFDETVLGSSLNETEIILQEYYVVVGSDQFYQLQGSPHDEFESTVLRVDLSFHDVNEIKRLDRLATRRRNTYIAFSSSLVTDTAGNPVVPVYNGTARQVTSFIPDRTPPRLTNFTLNLTSDMLLLTFSETVDISTVDLTQIFLQNDSSAVDIREVGLSSSYTQSENGAFVNVEFSDSDINVLKSFRDIATSSSDTYLSISSGFVMDTSLNFNEPIPSSAALSVSSFYADMVPPELDSFSFDLDSGWLSLTFSEPVDPSTINITEGRLLSKEQMFELTSDDVTTSPSIYVIVMFSESELNSLKRLSLLATSQENTNISFSSIFIEDMAQNPVIEVPLGDSRMASGFVPDETPPRLLSTSLSFETELLVFTFSETVNVNSLDLSEVYIQGRNDQLMPYVRLTGGNVSMENDTVLYVDLLTADLNRLKQDVGVATSNSTTYISFFEPIVLDMAGEPVEPVSSSDADPVSVVIDTTDPLLLSFGIDLNTGTLVLYFSETVNASSLNFTSISLQPVRNLSAVDDASTFDLTGGDFVLSDDPAVLNIMLTVDDLNDLKRSRVCRSSIDCYLSLLPEAVFDTNSNPIVPIPDTSALNVSVYTPDTTRPRLVSFQEIDLNGRSIELVFDETVNVKSIDFSGVTLQSYFRMPITRFTLRNDFVSSSSENGTVVRVTLDVPEIIRLQGEDRVCSVLSNCWLTVAMDTVLDMNGNGIAVIEDADALDVVDFLEDTVSPRLLNFTLDMDDGVMVLTFSEPIEPSTLVPTGLAILESPDLAALSVPLTGGSSDSPIGVELVLNLTDVDINVIKATRFAKNLNDTFLSVDEVTISDVALNPVESVQPDEALVAMLYIPDTTKPYLVNFTLDLATEVLSLSFNEPMVPSTLDVAGITIISGSVQRELTGGIVTPDTSFHGTTYVSVTLNRLDNEFLKVNTSDIFNLSIAMNTGVIADTAGNYQEPIPVDDPLMLPVGDVVQDTREAELDRFSLDMDLGRLYLTFTDVIVPSTFRPTSLTIQDAPTANAEVALTDSSYERNTEQLSYLVSVQISTEDLNRIKQLTTLATNVSNTYITLFSDVVRDLEDRDIQNPPSDDHGVQASSYIPDATPPELTSFDLDLDDGLLLLNFSETVNVNTLNVSGLVLQSSPVSDLSTISHVRLSVDDGRFPFTGDSSAFWVQLTADDLNSVKVLTDLATEEANTHLSIDEGTILDMVELPNTPLSHSNALKASSLMLDQTPPVLQTYSLNMTEGRLYFTFSEAVNPASLNVDGMFIQNTSDNFLHRVQLEKNAGTMSSSSPGVEVIIDIGRDNLNAIKRDRYLATSENNTFLFMDDTVIADMMGNFNQPFYNPFAKQVDEFAEDLKSPFLLTFSLDLNMGVLALTFDETVETSSTDVARITLQNVQNSTVDNNHTFNATSNDTVAIEVTIVESRQLIPGALPLFSLTFSADGPVVSIELGERDLNEIKRLPSLATNESNTYISLTSETLEDMNENLVTPISVESAEMAALLILDENPPSLRGFNLDMDLGLIELTFNETVDASSVKPSDFVFHSSPDASSYTHPLQTGVVTSNDSTVIEILIDTDDLNRIKEITQLATGVEDTYLRILEGGLQDVFGNAIKEIDVADSVHVTNFTEDNTRPVLKEFSLDLDSALVLVLTFDETVNASSLMVGGILLQQSNNDSIGEYHWLSPPSFTSSADSTRVAVNLSRQDANEIKRLTQLAIDQSSTFLTITDSTVKDMNGNDVRPTDEALQASDYTVDQSPPVLESFLLDLDSNQLWLTFDETINAGSVIFPMITVHSDQSVNDSVRTRTLLIGGTVDSNNSHVLILGLSDGDKNYIKLHPDIGTSVNNTFVTLRSGAITDLSTSENTNEQTTVQAYDIVPDLQNPVLEFFTVDLNAGRLTLHFNEPVDTGTFSPSALTLQSAKQSRTGVVLTNDSYTSSGNGLSIVVGLSLEDLNEIKRIDALFVDNSTSYVTVTSNLIRDTSGNKVVPIHNGNALPTSDFIADSGRPYLAHYSLDMDEGYATMYFSETVNVSTLDCSAITFSSSVACDVNYTLTTCSIDARNVSYDSEDIGDYGSAEKWMTDFHYETEASFYLTLWDLNALKALMIAESETTTYLSFTGNLVLDQSGLAIQEINCSMTALPISSGNYTPDTTPPEVVSFDLSVEEGELVISFSETVYTSMLMVQLITLQSQPNITTDTQLYSLTAASGVESNTPSDVLVIKIDPYDLNNIKRMTELAVSNSSTYLSSPGDTIVDMKSTQLVPIPQTDAMGVDEFEEDISPPLLVEYTLDMNNGTLLLTFDETVYQDSLDFTGLFLQVVSNLSVFDAANFNSTLNSTADNSTNATGQMETMEDLSQYENCSTFFLRLTGGYLQSLVNDPVVVVELLWDDLNDLKRERCLATNESNTHLGINNGTISDMNWNEIESTDPRMASKLIPDRMRPNLLNFDFNLTSEVLTLYFDETVDAAVFDPSQLALYSDPVMLVSVNVSQFNMTSNATLYDVFSYNTTVANYTLTGGTLLGGDDPVIMLRLSDHDLNNIKALTSLAVSFDTTFVTVMEALVNDMNSNPLNQLNEIDPLKVWNFTQDRIDPLLVAFELDLDANTVTLTFDETVNVSSLMVSGITLISNRSVSPEQLWQLSTNESFSVSENQPVVLVQLGYVDSNAIRRLSGLATSNETSFLSVEMGAVLDMNANPLVGIGSVDATPVSLYTPDTTAPFLVGFDLDLDAGSLTLEFSETVNASSLVLEQLVLQDNGSFPVSSLPLFNSFVLLEDNVFLYVSFGIDYLNILKQMDGLATEYNNTYLSFPSSALFDMSDNAVVLIANSSAEPVRQLTFDTTKPQILSFDLDMNTGVLTLRLTETVRASTVEVSQLTLSQYPHTYNTVVIYDVDNTTLNGTTSNTTSTNVSVPVGELYTLSDGVVQVFDSDVVMIQISLYDLNEIKKLRNLSSNASNTHLTLTSDALDDMYGNSVVAIGSGEGLPVSNFTQDATPPDVVWYHLDMNSGKLHLSFSETVDISTLVIRDTVVFYSERNFSGYSYSLSDSFTLSPNDPYVVIEFSPSDSNQLKFIRGLCSNIDNTFLFLNRSVSDMAGNVVTLLYMGAQEEARPANNFTADIISPDLVEFDFDLDAGLLHLTFSEVVDEINATAFVIQSSANDSSYHYQLTGLESLYGPSLLPIGPGHPPEMTLELTDGDLNALKALRSLAVSPNSTHLSISATAAVDAFNNSVNAIEMDEALGVSNWTADTTKPVLLSFDFSTDSGLVAFTFDETVLVESFELSTITFVNPETSTQYSVNFENDTYLSTEDSTMVEFVLSNDDLNELKILTDLATGANDTYIQLQNYSITDTSENMLNVSNIPLRVSNYTADRTNPVLTSFDLDMDNSTLVLHFSETVNVSSLDFTRVRLQQSSLDDGSSVQSYSLMMASNLGYPDETVTNSSNGPTVVLHLSTLDTNNIKRLSGLATREENTYLSITADLISDMTGLSVVPIDTGNASRVDKYTPDVTRPEFQGFDFDVDSGVLTLTFDETVDASTLQIDDITIQNLAESPTSEVSLRMSRVNSTDDPLVTVILEFEDLNRVKLDQNLATTDPDTYVALPLGAVMDLAFNANPSSPGVHTVTNFTSDSTRPTLRNFMININASMLTLNFDEPVDVQTFHVDQITFQSSSVRVEDPNLYFHLTGGTTDSPSGLMIVVNLDIDDINELKKRPGLLVSGDTSYISVTEELVSDMAGNPLVPIDSTDAQEAVMFVNDTSRPYVSAFHLDMDASRLHLTFPETVNASSVVFTSFVLQSDSYVMSNLSQYRLTGGELESYNNSINLSIILTLEDLNQIKAQQIATSTATSWLLVEDTALVDMNGNPILPFENGVNAQRAAMYTIDSTRPELLSFDFDLNTGILKFFFSETVRASSLISSTVSLQASSGASSSYYMIARQGQTLSQDSPNITLLLDVFDLNEIKRRPELGTQESNTYLSVRSSTIFDMQMNYLVPIPALIASEVSPDIEPPVLQEFNLDMDSANLTLTFDETVDGFTFDPTRLSFHDNNSSTATAVSLTGGLVLECYSTVVTMNLNDFDFNLMKIRKDLCSGSDGAMDCFLDVETDAIFDMAGLSNVANLSVPASSVEPDVTNATLLYYDLDLTQEELRLTFSEVAEDFGDFTAQQITIQAREFEIDALSDASKGVNLDASDEETFIGTLRAYTLSGADGSLTGSIKDPGHPPVLVLPLTDKDLNILKSLESVATAAENTYLLITADAVQDTSGT